MKTYIIKSNGFIKIGRASNMARRLKVYNTHNPNYSVLKILDIDIESQLHTIFKNKKHRNEWFLLDEIDIEYLLSDRIIDECKQKKLEMLNKLLESEEIPVGGEIKLIDIKDKIKEWRYLQGNNKISYNSIVSLGIVSTEHK